MITTDEGQTVGVAYAYVRVAQYSVTAVDFSPGWMEEQRLNSRRVQ